MRIAVLYSRLSGYTASCLKALTDTSQVGLLVIRIPPAEGAPFQSDYFNWIERLYDRPNLTSSQMIELLEEFGPDAIYMTGWFDQGYLRVARHLKKSGIPVIAGSDAQWKGSLRQQLARIIAPMYLHSAIDALWIAGDRQYQFAKRLGFDGGKIMRGCYSCDWDAFASVYSERSESSGNSFLFVGRYVQVKGLDVLIEAYEKYRTLVDNPWSLVCAGTGEHKTLLEGVEGVRDVGFVQPEHLPDLMEQSSAFVLPSRREPWGVVVHEACTTGLPLVCSDAVGAADHLVVEGQNGYIFKNGDATDLADRMMQISEATKEELQDMRVCSHELSKQYTPTKWADTLVNGIRSLKGPN